MTAEDYAALKAEIERLETVERRALSARIKTAREWGDLKENAEYHDAKNDQAHLETKILLLRDKEKRSQVVEAQVGGDTVGFGSTVVVNDPATGKDSTFTIVSVTEAKPGEGKIAASSPVGEALSGAKIGQTVEVQTPKGARPLKVIAIS